MCLIRQRVKIDFLSYDFFFLIFLVLLAMQWLFSVNNFIYFYLLVELVSLAAYVLSSFDVFSAKSTEAGLKYFVVGSLASIFLLYSISFFYGVFGTTVFSDLYLLSAVLLNDVGMQHMYNLVVFSVTLLVCSLLFKLGLAPLHLWIVDVYSGLNYAVFSFFSIFYKFIFFFLLYKFFVYTFFFFFTHIYYILIIFAISSIIVGCFGAFVTDDIRKILVYSSINHGGFLCLGLLNLSVFGYFSFVFYLFVYSYLLFFLFFVFFRFEILGNARALDSLSDLSAMRGVSSVSAVCLIMVLFSMAGIPPFIGFFSKFFIFFNLFQYFFNFNVFLVFLFLFLSGISIFVYLRMIAFIFFDAESYMFQFNVRSSFFYRTGLFVFSLLNFFCLFFFYLVF
jgi:NADH-quinone oxidoreductase subunit N